MAASTPLRSAAVGPLRTALGAPPAPSRAAAPETPGTASDGRVGAAGAGFADSAEGSVFTGTGAGADATADSGAARGDFSFAAGAGLPPGDFFGAPAFGAGGCSAAGSCGAGCWGSTGAGAAGGAAGAAAAASGTTPVSWAGAAAPVERLRIATAIAAMAIRRPPPASARESGALCRRTTTGAAVPGPASGAGATASSVVAAGGPTPPGSAATVPAPVATAPVRGVDDSGTGVRISGIGLLGVVTPIARRCPVLAIAMSWLRGGSFGVSVGEPVAAMTSSTDGQRSAGSLAIIRITAARRPSGQSGRTFSMGAGTWCTCAYIMAIMPPPVKGGLPVSITYATTPREY